MADKIVKRGISIFIDGKEVSNSVKAIGGELKKLQNEQAKMIIGADNYNAHAKKIEYLKSLLKEHGDNQKKIASEYNNMDKAAEKYNKNSESRMSKLANGFNKYLALMTSFFATITGITLGLKKFMDMRMELEDSAANLQSLTGLGDGDITWLKQYAKTLSTNITEMGIRIKATSKEIMDGFTVIGSKRPELLKNKEAMADLTKQALILAETGVPVDQAFEVVTASLNQFNLEAKEGKRVINAIAAGSLAGSAEADSLAASLKNVGTVANDSNMSLEDTVAMLEVLASKQLTGEEAGTKLRGALLKLKEAGVGYASGQFSVRDALEEVNKKMSEHSSAAQRDALLQKIFGAENVTAGTILLQNVDAYDKLKVAVTGTNTAYDQAIIRTKTTSALLAQAKNKFSEMGMELVANLSPAILHAANMGNSFLKILIKFPEIWKNYRSGILALISAFGVYSSILLLHNSITKIKLALAVVEKAYDFAKVISLRLRIALTGQATIAELRLVAAQNALNASMKANLWGLIAAAIAAAVVYFGSWIAKLKEATKAQKIFNDINSEFQDNYKENSKSILEEKANLTSLVTAIINTNNNQSTRNRLITELNAKYPDFIAFIDKEKVSNELLSNALADVNEKYDLKLKSVAINSKVQTYEQAIVKSMQRQLDIQTELSDLRTAPGDWSKKIKQLEDEDLQLSRNINTYKKAASDFRASAVANDAIIKSMDTSDYYKHQMDQLKDFIRLNAEKRDQEQQGSEKWTYYNNQIKQANSAFAFAREKYSQIKKMEDEASKNKPKPTPNPVTDTKQKPETEDPYSKALKEKEDYWKNDEALNKRAYAEDKIEEDAYHEWMFQNKMGFLQDKLALQKKYGKDTLDTEIEIQDALISENEYWNNKEKKQDKDLLKSKSDSVKDREELAREISNIMDKYGVDEAGRLKAQKDLELKIAKDAYDQGIIDAKQYAEAIKKINENIKLPKWAEDTRDIAGGIANVAYEFSNAMQGFQSAEEKSIETKYQKQIDAARKAGKDTTKIEEKKEKELAAIRAKNADSTFSVQIAMIASSTAEAAISAYASALKVPIIGPVLAPIAAAAAVTYGMSQVAQAKAARDAAKAGYYYGGWNTPDGESPSGYTGGTDPREVRGIFPNGQPYHGQEFISNHHLTTNREMKPAFDLFDAAQRNGTAGSLTRKDLVKALSPSGGYYSGGWNGSSFKPMSPAGNDNYAGSDPELKRQLTRLNDHLDKGINAPIYMHGDNGLARKFRDYNTMINNAKG